MNKKHKIFSITSLKAWVLEFYFIFIVFLVGQKAFDLFLQDSFSALYFQFLNAFYPPYACSYLLTIARVIMNTLNCIPLYLAIHNRSIFTPIVWKILFFLKIIFDILGHSLEIKDLTAIYYANPPTTLLILATNIIVHLPWYFILFYHAFQGKEFSLLLKQTLKHPNKNQSDHKNDSLNFNSQRENAQITIL